jgi:hypothetical protein
MLRRALQADSAVSLISGLVFLIDAQPIATFTGFPWVWAIEALGAGFLVYAALLFLAARRAPIDRRHALGFVAADAGWAIASVALVMGGWAPLTSAGVWVVLALADVGAVFAVLKYVGMRRAS